MEPKVVLVIPYFNGKEFVKRCLTSINNQTYKNFDVIMIDDGSTDGSFLEVNNFNKKIGLRLKNISLPFNKGLSAARNEGLRIAKENYSNETFIAFLDIDDYLAPDYLSKLISMCEENGADIACSSLFYATNYGNFKHVLFPNKDDSPITMSSFESLYNVLKDNKITSWIPTKLFKLGIFENVTFPEEIRYFEDRATTFKLFINCNKAVFSNYCGYFYNQVSSNSITRGNKENIKKLISLQSYLSCVKYEYSNHYTKAQCKQLICAAKEGYINTLLMVIGTFDYGNKDETKKLKFFKRQVSFIDLMKYNPPKKKNKKKKWVYILLNPFYVLIYKKWLSKHRK